MRDYAKRPSPNKHKNKSEGTGILVFLVICTLLFAGYVTYHFTHKSVVKSHSQSIAQQNASDKTNQKLTTPDKTEKKIEPKKKIKKTKPVNPADIQPKYDFYKMLPAMTVPIPKNDAPLPLGPSQSEKKQPQAHD